MNYMEERVIEMNENILRNEAIKAIDTLVRFIENNYYLRNQLILI